ncbi:Peptidase [Erwinia sp. Ejp617]|nr:trypsin-like peptidase domain-containing protein [Erwinia sp. Ejp617]ADP10255.1 Peptidase [Erwinia sp. Ejp617]
MEAKFNKLLLSTILIANLYGVSAFAEKPRRLPENHQIDHVVITSKNLLDRNPGDRVKSFQFTQKDALLLRAELDSQNLPEKTVIIVSNRDNTEKYIYSDKKGLWQTMTITGDTINLEVHFPRESDYSSASLVLKRILYTPLAAKDRSIIGEKDERRRLVCYKDDNNAIYEHGLSSVYMLLGNKGSGSLLGKDNLFLTNHHVVKTTEEVKNGEIWLNWYHRNCSEDDKTEKKPIKIQGGKLLSHGSGGAKDYALLTADPFDFKYGNIKRLFGGLAISKKNPAIGEALHIPQYGNGTIRPAYVADTESGSPCKLLSAGAVLAYNCDTRSGSSGSPVISLVSQMLVGVHYASGSDKNLAVGAETLIKDLSAFITDKNNQSQLPLSYEINANQLSISPFSYQGELAISEKPIWFSSSDPELNIEHQHDYSLVTFMKKNLQTGDIVKDENKPLKLWLENNCGKFAIDKKPFCRNPGKTSLKYAMDVEEKDFTNGSWKKYWLLLTQHDEQQNKEENVFQISESFYDVISPPFAEESAIVKELVLQEKTTEKLSWAYEGKDNLGLVAFYAEQGPVSLVRRVDGRTEVPVILRDEKRDLMQKVILDVSRRTACSETQMNSSVTCKASDKYTEFNVRFNPGKNPGILDGKFMGILPLKLKSSDGEVEENVLYKISLDNQKETPEDIPDWNSATIYEQACQKVKYAGKVWLNGWWTQNSPPGKAGAWDVWREEGSVDMHTHCK